MENISIKQLIKGKFVQAKCIHYTQNGLKKTWEIVDVHDSVSILIYHKEKKVFLLVKQLRPAVYLKNKNGFTYELCAGICDKDSSLTQIASEEILEECGYEVPAKKLEKIASYYTAVGFAASKQTLFYAEVDEKMKKNEGGGIGLEDIEVIEVDINEISSFLFDESKVKTSTLMFAFMWWHKDRSLSIK